MIICIREGIKEINTNLPDMGKTEFKLVYCPNVVSLLSVLNIFRRSLHVDGSIDLSDGSLLTENVGTSIGRLLMERVNLLNLMNDKISFLQSHESSNPNVFKLTSIPMGSLDDHHETIELQTKMLIVQVLFDIYKIVSVELHRRTNCSDVHNFDFFDGCPTCTNDFLMRGEYQTMVDSVRESLPLNGRIVKFQYDPFQQETIYECKQIKFIETSREEKAEEKFQKQCELGRYALQLDLEPKPIREYGGLFTNFRVKCGSVNNVVNHKSIKLSSLINGVLLDGGNHDFTADVNVILRLINGSPKRHSPEKNFGKHKRFGKIPTIF